VTIQLTGLFTLFQDENDFQVGFVARDGAVLDQHVHVLDMGGLDIPKRAGGTLDGLVDCILETLL
jgi:hypothetical protein